MGILKQQIDSLIKECRGLDIAKKDSFNWYKKVAMSNGDTSVTTVSGPFVPGKIYIFRYENPVTIHKLKWWDKNPLVLSLGRIDGKDIGINLNLLPYKFKIYLLDSIYEHYSSKIESNIKRGKGDAAIEPNLPQFNYDKIKFFLKKNGFNFAIRCYITSLRKNTRVISFSKWNKVALIDINNFSNIDVNKVYSEFYKYIKNKK